METTRNDSGSGSDEAIHPVFWTGGWDSTLRVFDLIVHYGIKVQPIYVVDKSRRSWKIELQTRERIQEQFEKEYPDRAHLLTESLYLDKAALESKEEPNRSYLRVAGDKNVSPQYAYLALAVANSGYPKVEVAVHSDDNATTLDFLRDRVFEVTHPSGTRWFELDAWDPADSYEYAMKVFESMRFPYLRTHPSELQRLADEHGLNSLLSLTWTCHRPILGYPCGVCGVCRLAIESGKTRHFPKSSLIRYRFHPILSPLWVMIVNPKGGIRKIASKLRLRS